MFKISSVLNFTKISCSVRLWHNISDNILIHGLTVPKHDERLEKVLQTLKKMDWPWIETSVNLSNVKTLAYFDKDRKNQYCCRCLSGRALSDSCTRTRGKNLRVSQVEAYSYWKKCYSQTKKKLWLQYGHAKNSTPISME